MRTSFEQKEPININTLRTSFQQKEPITIGNILDDSPSNSVDQVDQHPQKIDIENWSGANLETLSQWIQISSLQIEILDLAIKYYRAIVRKNVLLGLVFSTASGSISLSQMSSGQQQFVYNLIFTIMSFSIAVFTGLIKIYQIQERLEEFIQLKQEWIGFSVVITTEIQLPVVERKKALDIITKNKNKYLDLLKRDADIPNFIKGRAFKNLYHDKDHYLTNQKKYKKLKEISSCTDEKYFLKAARLLEDDDTMLFQEEPDECRWTNCICLGTNRLTNYLLEFYKYVANNKDKYVGEKTALSNIILTVIMEEENEQRNKNIIELLNNIRERRTYLETKLTEYDVAISTKRRQNSFESMDVKV